MEVGTMRTDVKGEYTSKYTVVAFIPETPKEEAQLRPSIIDRAIAKFSLTHPLYTPHDVTDLLISLKRRVGNVGVYEVLVSYWKREAEQV